MEKKSLRISVVIITYNEEKNIRQCLDSIKWVKEIIIVDSYSKDKTIDIIKKYTKKIYYRKFNNNFSKQRNFALQKASSPWVFVLDADEELDDKASYKIEKLLNNDIDGYWFPRRNYINEKKYLLHGFFYPDYQLRLFRKKSFIRYKGFVHEQPIIIGKTKKINNVVIYHNSSRTKYNSFFSLYRFFSLIKIESEQRAIANISYMNILFSGLRDLLRDFYWSFYRDKGYKDGYDGFKAALIYSIYRWTVSIYTVFLKLKISHETRRCT